MRASAALLVVLFTTSAWGQTPVPPAQPRQPRRQAAVIAVPQGGQAQPGAAAKGQEAPPPPEPDEGTLGVSPREVTALFIQGRSNLSTVSSRSPDAYLASPESRTLLQPYLAGVQGGVEDVVSEVVLILGEIVVDRATNRAFDLLKTKLEVGLACDPLDKSRFPRTCEVVAPLRLQDLAVTTSALQGAVLQDAMRMGLQKTKATTTGRLSNEDFAFLSRVIQAGLLPYFTRPHRPLSNKEASALVQDLLAFAIGKAKLNPGPCVQPSADETHAAAAVMVTAGAALTACLETSLRSGLDPSNCSVMQLADEFAGQCDYLKNSPKRLEYTHHARIIAQHLHVAATARVDDNPNGAPDVRARMGHAVDAVFEMSCRLARLDAGCDSALDANDDARAIGILRTVAHAALDRDTNALIGAASTAITLVDHGQSETARRGLRIVGGALQYAETYYTPAAIKQEGSARVEAATDSDAETTAHASRRRILKSLTEEMTDRTGRETDRIVSIGGSLRATAGARFLSGEGRDTEFEGPLSLPLGLGLQVPLTQEGGHGLHLEVGIVDLGRYVAIRDRTVKRFDVGDALAPSLTAGYYWGQQFPFFLGVSGIYQPLFVAPAVEAQGEAPALPESVGAWSLAFNVGVFVPLFDLN